MNENYLDELPLPAGVKAKIARLGVPNAAALVAMIQAAPEEFAEYIGRDNLVHLTALLEARLSEAARTVLVAPTQRHPATGAILEKKAPVLSAPNYDLATRDGLFEQLQRLRQQPTPSPESKRRMTEIEQSLNALLEGV